MVSVSDLAVEQMREVVRQQNVSGLAVRVFVQSADHGHVAYGMGLDDEIQPDDTVIDLGGVNLVVDADSAPYLEGAEIDYVDALMGKGFTVSNPNFAPQAGGCACGRGTCGCGHSH
jgi:iron-sulfur cluster assembly accessory protein